MDKDTKELLTANLPIYRRAMRPNTSSMDKEWLIQAWPSLSMVTKLEIIGLAALDYLGVNDAKAN